MTSSYHVLIRTLIRVFEVVLARLYSLHCWTRISSSSQKGDNGFQELATNDIEQCQYFIHTVFNMLSGITEESWSALASDLVPSVLSATEPLSSEGKRNSPLKFFL